MRLLCMSELSPVNCIYVYIVYQFVLLVICLSLAFYCLFRGFILCLIIYFILSSKIFRVVMTFLFDWMFYRLYIIVLHIYTYIYIYIVAYLLKARAVETEKQPLLAKDYETKFVSRQRKSVARQQIINKQE